jgi:YfiH family protein
MWTTESTSLGRILVPPSVPEGVTLFYTTSDFRGRLSGEIAGDVASVVRERLGRDAVLATCNQVHGAQTMRAPRVVEWEECAACDALWTDEPGRALAIKVADCLPVTLIEPKHHLIANVHAGWRGVGQRIVDAAIDEVTRLGGFEPIAAHVYLGPSIRACCFEVGEEVVARLEQVYGDIERYVDRSKAKPHVDLVAITRDALIARGVDPTRIHDSGVCTRCDGSIFHSYRRSPEAGGRNLAIVAQG